MLLTDSSIVAHVRGHLVTGAQNALSITIFLAFLAFLAVEGLYDWVHAASKEERHETQAVQ